MAGRDELRDWLTRKRDHMKITRLAAPAALLALLAAGCAGPAMYVTAGDPVLRTCQAASVQDIASLQSIVDEANSTNDSSMGGEGIEMSAGQISSLQQAAVKYRLLAAQVPAHPGFAAALRNEAQEFMVATSDNGLTTNSVAIAVDKFAGQIQGDCGSFTVGTAPQAGKPGPGFDWGLFWLVTGGYLAMTLIASYVIAYGQRSRRRKKRLAPAQIFWLSMVWWVTIFTALGAAYRQSIASATLTRDEKKDDRLAALAKENARLEVQLRKPLP